MAAQAARAAGNESATPASGPWRVTLDGPSYIGFMKHAKRRDLRETLYRAHLRRASEGALDNRPLIDAILRLRREEAKLLGFETYADLSLSRKMAGTVARAERLLEELLSASHDAAVRDLEEVRAFMIERGASEEARDIRHWDVPYWSERLREARYDYSEEQIRQFFPMPRVLDGLFALAKRLFAVEVTPADGEAPVWHEDVRFFKVRSLEGEEIAAFYLDPYSRPGGEAGWRVDERGLREEPALRLRWTKASDSPWRISSATGRLPVGDNPSLMTFREIETLFHEFGHALQHMLTRVDLGTRLGHPERGVGRGRASEPVHGELVLSPGDARRSLRARGDGSAASRRALREDPRLAHFPGGAHDLRQLNFGFLDLELHHRFTAGRRRDSLRRAAPGRGPRHGARADSRGSIPLRLLAHLPGGLRRGLLLLQVG